MQTRQPIQTAPSRPGRASSALSHDTPAVGELALYRQVSGVGILAARRQVHPAALPRWASLVSARPTVREAWQL